MAEGDVALASIKPDRAAPEPRGWQSAVLLAAVVVLFAVFRIADEDGPLSWSATEGEAALKVAVWVVPSIMLVALVYRASVRDALVELGLWSNPLIGYAFGLAASLPTLVWFGAGLPFVGTPSLVADVLLGPFAEEVLFRGLLFRQLYRRARRHPLRAMVVSALVFGGAHVVNTNWSLGPAGLQAAAAVVGTATLGGLLFAWVAYRWDSIWPAIGLHAGLNLAWDLTQGDAGRAIVTARVASVVIALLITWRVTRDEGRGQNTEGRGQNSEGRSQEPADAGRHSSSSL